jgi:hypothetical protein
VVGRVLLEHIGQAQPVERGTQLSPSVVTSSTTSG